MRFVHVDSKIFLSILLTCLMALVTLICPGQQALAQSDVLRIQSVQFDSANQTIRMTAQDGAQFQDDFQMVRLTQPQRVIIDVPNAILSTPQRTVYINNNGLDRIELSQTFGTFYQVVRMTVYATNDQALNNLQVDHSGKTLKVMLAQSPEAQAMMNRPPLPAVGKQYSFLDDGTMQNVSMRQDHNWGDMNVIHGVNFKSGVLQIQAEKGNALMVKNQFTLTAPNRLVVDLSNAVLAEKSLSDPIQVYDSEVHTIRLGQFERDTVRVVIEVNRPNRIHVVYPGTDKSVIAFSSDGNYTAQTLPSSYQKIGLIDDINVLKKGNNSVVQIVTSDPMANRMVRRGNQVIVEFSNISARTSFVAYDKEAFPEIRSIRLMPMSATEPNTRLIIELKDKTGVNVESNVSMDNRTMEVSVASDRMVSQNYVDSGDEDLAPVPVSSLQKGKYVVVVDAGHGGHDEGATRDGIKEKNINLAIALKLRKALESRGVQVRMTRDDDTFVPLPGITGFTNQVNPDAFVSVHTNASVNPSANGLETYYLTPQSRRLATLVHRRLVNHVDSPDRGTRTARFYVIHHTNVPAILCEIGYVSNPVERAAIITESRQRATAEAIAQGVVEFLGQQYRAEASPANENEKVFAE